MVKVFEDHLNEPRPRDGALALVAPLVLTTNVGDPALSNDFRRTSHAEVLRIADWSRRLPTYSSSLSKPALNGAELGAAA
jgi:hypothetical protein